MCAATATVCVAYARPAQECSAANRARCRGAQRPGHRVAFEAFVKERSGAGGKGRHLPWRERPGAPAFPAGLAPRRTAASPEGGRSVMTISRRSTLVVHGRLAMRERRLAASRDRRHGLQIMSFEQAAVRLAGGFIRPIDDESLRAAILSIRERAQCPCERPDRSRSKCNSERSVIAGARRLRFRGSGHSRGCIGGEPDLLASERRESLVDPVRHYSSHDSLPQNGHSTARSWGDRPASGTWSRRCMIFSGLVTRFVVHHAIYRTVAAVLFSGTS